MAEQFSAEWAKGVIDDNVQKAQSFIDDPEQINGLLEELQQKLEGLPDTVSNAFNNVPIMAEMVKSYATREYTDVSPKVILSLVGAFAYLVKKNDIIPDSVPVIGFADDLAVATVAMVINEPELKAFAEWKAQQTGTPIDLVEVAPVQQAQPVQPMQQAQPVQPVQQAQPVQPVQPVQPTQPTQPPVQQ